MVRRTSWMRVKGLDEFDALVKMRAIRMLFQPIVDLASGQTVGFEALARPPLGSSYPDIAALFAEAYRRNVVGEFDWICRGAAFDASIAAGVPAEVPIFINVEPTAMNAPCPADIIGPFMQALQSHRFVVEVTERALLRDPAELLDALARTRDMSVGVALDDVGADPASLALMPLVAPDVIKLDLRLIQRRPSIEIARIVSAVLAEQERTGAVILAEGIESEEHLLAARSMGAALGQGWRFGRPSDLPAPINRPSSPLPLEPGRQAAWETPYSGMVGRRAPVASTRELLGATCRYLEDEVRAGTDGAVLLSSFEVAENFTTGVRHRYERLAPATVLTAAMAKDMPPHPGRRVRGVNLDPQDPLANEWAVVALGTRTATALVARRTDNSPPDGPGRFEAIITHDRNAVIDAARSLVLRLPPMDE